MNTSATIDPSAANVSAAPGAVLHPAHRFAGFSLVEALAVLAVGAIVIAFAIPKIQEMFFNTNVEQAYSETVDLIIAGQKYRTINGDYDGITVTKLKDEGYGLQKYSDGTEENAYGLDITIAEKNSDADAEITYEFDSEEGCEQIEARVSNIKAVKTSPTPACAGSGPYTLTFQIH